VLTDVAVVTLDSTGAGKVLFVPPPTSQWVLQQVAVSGGIATAGVYVNNAFLCGTSTAQGDSADGDIALPVGATVSIRFANGTPGQQSTATIYYTPLSTL
jgi:hypothetical protein